MISSFDSTNWLMIESNEEGGVHLWSFDKSVLGGSFAYTYGHRIN